MSHTFFTKKPGEFYRFYKERVLALDAKPNPAHKKLAEMESKGKLRAVITQNIDGLHQAAGAKIVYELHGSVHRNNCMACGKFFDARYIAAADDVPICDECGSLVKPDVVLYEEGLDSDTISASIEAIRTADVLIVGGTSLVVYPAAGLIDYFVGDKLVLLNKGATARNANANLVITEPIGEVLSQICI